MAMNIDVVSQLVAEAGVDALISTEPVIPTMDKGLGKTYENKTFQSGDTINIRLEDQPMMPVQSNVIQIDPINQREISATVLQYNDGMSISGIEQEYNLGGEARVRERIANPRMRNMAVQAAILCYNEMGTAMNFFGTAGTALKTAADWGLGRAVLDDQLAMGENLFIAMSNQSLTDTYGSVAAAFNPSEVSSVAYMKGKVKEVAGLNIYGTSNIPNHTNGSAVATGTSGMAVSANVTTGATSFTVSGGTANGTITKNSIIFFGTATAKLAAVQPNTKKSLSTARYYTVAANVTLNGSGAGTITVTEPIYGPENNKLQNISVLPTTAHFVGIVGAASTTYEQALCYKEKSTAFIGLELPDLYALKVSRADYEGVPVKVTAYGDGTNYLNQMRWDILCVAKIRQWRHVARAFTRVIPV